MTQGTLKLRLCHATACETMNDRPQQLADITQFPRADHATVTRQDLLNERCT